MVHTIISLLIIIGVILIICIMMQPSKQQDALNALSGGSSDLFQTHKSRGFQAIMKRITSFLTGLWLLLGILLMYIENK